MMMHQPDSRICEIKNVDGHLCSHDKLGTLGKVEGLLECSGKSNDSNTMLNKERHTLNQEICCEADTSHEMESHCPSSLVSLSDQTEGGEANNSPPVSARSDSRNIVVDGGIYQKEICAEGTSGITSCNSIFASSSVHSNSKGGEPTTNPLDGIDSKNHLFVRGDVNSETGPPLKRENNMLGSGKAKENEPNASEVSLKLVKDTGFRLTPPKTESSSSNSTHVSLPISYSNDSYQEISGKATSYKNYSHGLNSYIRMGIDHSSMDEAVVGSAVLGMAAKITQKAVDNVRARDSKKCLAMIADQNSMNVEKDSTKRASMQQQKNAELLDQHKEQLSSELSDAPEVASKVAKEVAQMAGYRQETSGSSSSILERNSGTVVWSSSVDSADPNKSNSAEKGQGVNLQNEQDNSGSFCSSEEVVDPGRPTKYRPFVAVNRQSQESDPTVKHEANDTCPASQSVANPLVAPDHHTSLPIGFDLNEDIRQNEMDFPKQAVIEPQSSYSEINVPVPVMAKPGIPLRLPWTASKFVGELGWKGSSATSAFKPTSLLNKFNKSIASSNNLKYCCSSRSQDLTKFDLNVAAAEDDSAMKFLPKESASIPSSNGFKECSVEISSNRAERPNIDLNCLYETDDQDQNLQRVSSSKHFVVDFDLNDHPSATDAYNNAHASYQNSQSVRHKVAGDPAVSFVGNLIHPDFHVPRPSNCVNLRSMQGFNHVYSHPFLVAAPNVLTSADQIQKVYPVHSKLPYAPHLPPPHFYLGNGFCMDRIDSNSSGVLPYIMDPRGNTAIPQLLAPASLSAFSRAPQMEVTGGPNPGYITNIRPYLDVHSGVNSSEYGSRAENAGKSMFPVKSSLMGEQLKSFEHVDLSISSVKRKEPEGERGNYQLGSRQMTSWH